jgi:hypothetical protein
MVPASLKHGKKAEIRRERLTAAIIRGFNATIA